MPVKTASKKPAKATKSVAKKQSKVRIIIRSFDYSIIDEAARSIIQTAEKNGGLVSGPIPLPTKIKKITVNRSTFVNKDARDQYEIRTHKRIIDINEPNDKIIESLQNLFIPSGVSLEIKILN